ncbi:MAG: TonB-dependent receptor [Oleispira antarctica]|nr:TonB-dependent receptor [Oleispira antarctica]MBQ0791413.1 TonB-dependent receptor [Oleispira antarctica]
MLYRFILAAALIPIAHATELDKVIIKSSTQTSIHDIAQSVLVIDEEALRKSQAKSLGELLEQQPGVSNASFGPGVGRPVLRGLSGSRVKTLVNGQDSSDLSAMSSDHAPMAEITNAQQVEVIQGPATLLYGSGAIGGIVNVIDRSILQSPQLETEGSLKASISSNDQAQTLATEINSGDGRWAIHIDAYDKKSNDYHSGKTRIKNSDTNTQGGSIGISKTSLEHGFIGASISVLEQDYAIPNINETQTRVRPKQTRFNLASAWLTPTTGIERWATNVSVSDYAHDELTRPITEGLFEKDSIEINSKIEHSTLFGWRGTLGINVAQQKIKLCHDHTGCDKIPDYSNQQWNGNQGNLFTTQGGYEFVHDTPMPITESSNIGYFLVEHKPWEIEGIGQGIIELGARIDIKKIEADPISINPSSRRVKEYYDDKNFFPTTFSAASTWFLNDTQRLSLSSSRAQRAPDGEELYWNGDHHATFSYQLDNAYLTEETAYTTDLIWNITGEKHLIRSAVYYYHFNDYIYNDLKNITDPYHNHPVYKHEQEDARFYGFEFSWQQQLTHALSGTLSLDSVRAHLLEGEDKGVPRLPPTTASIKINWKNNNWSASAENHWVAKQNIIAQGERSTAGFNTFDIAADYTVYFSQKEIVTRLKINNLFNVTSTNHVSYLKEFAPNSGRNIQLQSQLYF